MSFNPNPIYYSTEAWSLDDPAVRYNLRLVNKTATNIDVRKLFILNNISNYQEANSLLSFCIVFNNFDYTNVTDSSTVNSIIGSPNNYDIPYPSYYGFQPGNTIYYDYTYPSSIESYKATKTFTLQPADYVSFDLVFNPGNRSIDFYRASIIFEYVIHGSSTVYTKYNRVNANYLNNVDEVDGKDFGELILSMNGVPIHDIILTQ